MLDLGRGKKYTGVAVFLPHQFVVTHDSYACFPSKEKKMVPGQNVESVWSCLQPIGRAAPKQALTHEGQKEDVSDCPVTGPVDRLYDKSVPSASHSF